ncbi:sugar phosphate isomerase/epimerase family protein [Metabacillus halosaccharovorans]|uniref:Sugar phosphate isomerase/epimerase n=1 Tax=Metabacillus halosaccharovorans TaxID=930124 RepID=A0ABT3DFS9_9BACI|nr:sugar phosphate isomerase/epimerase [Metabacillus halosaccharovorans]MCV9885915.1 sugar phosphate isomerase/epimerase [Metabacillus halosaccharovorans]
MNRQIGMRIPPKLGAEGIESLAKWASSIGIDVIDVPYFNEEVKTALEANGLEVGSIDGLGAVGQTKLLSTDDKVRLQAVESINAQFSEIATLGGRVIFMCLVPEDIMTDRKEAFSIWKETFPSIVKQAEKENLYIALEGWPGPAPYYPTLGTTPEMLRAMFNEIPSKHFGLNYDPSHLVRLGIDHLRVLTEFGDRVNYCHGKDTEILHDDLYEHGILAATFGAKYDFSEGSWRYTIPGQGEVDWGKVAVRLDKIGYQGPVSIELEDHRYWGSLEAERQGIIKAKEHLSIYFK